MARIVVKKDTILQPQIKDPKRRTYATICYYYPQYTLIQAQKLPARDIYLLINTARRLEQQNLFHLTRIAAAPYTEKRKGLLELQNEYSKGANI